MSYLPHEKLKHLFGMFNIWSLQLKYSCRNTKTNIHLPLLHATNVLVFHYSPVNHLWCNSV